MQLISDHLGSHLNQLDKQTGAVCSLQRTSLTPSSLCRPLKTQIVNFTVYCRRVQLVCVGAEVGNDNLGELFGGTIACKPSNRVTSAKHRKSLAPLQLESSEGQALMEMLQNHEKLSPAASQHVEGLAAKWQVAPTVERERKSGNDDYELYRRIASIKEKERSTVVQDIMYALVVERLVNADLSMALPMASAQACERKLDFAPKEHKKLEALLPPEARELIQDHVAMVIGGRNAATRWSFDPDAFTRINKLTMGKIYAASAMYGYFLRRVHQRFKLDEQLSWLEVRRGEGQSGREEEMTTYVRSMDAETKQRHGRMKVEASVQLIERHVEALFGKPEAIWMPRAGVGNSPPLQSPTGYVYVKLGAVKSLLLEALAFGSALWDVEAFLASSHPLSL